MSAHTPGPWVVTGVSKISGRLAIRAASEEAPIIASTYVKRQPTAEQTANARLIAAAPELLEALRKARDIIDELNDGGSNRYVGADHRLAFIGAAISAATGGAP